MRPCLCAGHSLWRRPPGYSEANPCGAGRLLAGGRVDCAPVRAKTTTRRWMEGEKRPPRGGGIAQSESAAAARFFTTGLERPARRRRLRGACGAVLVVLPGAVAKAVVTPALVAVWGSLNRQNGAARVRVGHPVEGVGRVRPIDLVHIRRGLHVAVRGIAQLVLVRIGAGSAREQGAAGGDRKGNSGGWHGIVGHHGDPYVTGRRYSSNPVAGNRQSPPLITIKL